jgi:hypothetical protein
MLALLAEMVTSQCFAATLFSLKKSLRRAKHRGPTIGGETTDAVSANTKERKAAHLERKKSANFLFCALL